MGAYDPYDSTQFHAWNHDLQTFHAIPRMESYDFIHGNAWNQIIPWMESYGTKSKNCKFSKFQIFVLLACHFPETTGKQLDMIRIELENRKRYNKTGKSECFQTVRYKNLGFQLPDTKTYSQIDASE